MHILESYALNTASKISEPYIYEDFFPLAVDKYITLDNYPEDDSRDYKYWNDVMSEVIPEFKKLGISIVQLCGNPQREIKECYSISASTTQNQNAYIIRNSLLHLGVDNINSEFASHYKIKQICLIAAVHKSTSKPFWDNENCVCISPEIEAKPTYISNEEPRTINIIKPELIINKIFELLDISYSFNFDTLSVGRLYPSRSVHFLCDSPVLNYDLSELTPDIDLKIRLDSGTPDTSIFMDFLSRINHKEISVVTSKTFQPEQLLPFKNKIKVIYLIDENHDSTFVSRLRQLGIKFELFSRMSDKEIAPFKLEYMDLGLIHNQQDKTFDDTEGSKDDYTGIINYKSSKVVMSKGKFFPSEYSLSLNEGSENWPTNKIFESVEINNRSPLSDFFWKDSKYFRILKKSVD